MATNTHHMPPERDASSGQYVPEYPPEAFIEAINELGGSASTTEVADKVGCDRRTAHLRLTELDDENMVVGRRVGRAYLWSLPEDNQ